MISNHTTPEELIYDYRNVIFFENGLVFENVFRPPLKRKAVSFKFHQLKKPVFKKLHFHEELVRTVGLHEEIQLCFKIYPSEGGAALCNCSHTVIQVTTVIARVIKIHRAQFLT